MRANQLRAHLQAGRPALGGWCAFANSYTAEVVADAGFEYVGVDMQHGLAGIGDLVPMLQAVGGRGATPLVRIPHGDLATAQRALDAGAEGLVIPLVSTREEARAAVAACRYPPLGSRSFGPVRARMHLGADPDHANGEVLCFVQIETRGGLERLGEILDCPGIDGAYVGPADLSLALGIPVGEDSADLRDALARVVAECRRRELFAAVHTPSGEAASRALEQGFAMATIANDALVLSAAYRRELQAARSGLPRQVPAGGEGVLQTPGGDLSPSLQP